MIDNIWKENITVSSFDVGASGYLEACALMRYFQEAAARHATSLGVGFKDLKRDHIFWVLSHLQLEAERWPDMDEPISIETWPRDIEKLYTTRDFLVKDARDKIIARSSSAWIMVDAKRKRPVRPAERLKSIPFTPEAKALGDFPPSISNKNVSQISEHTRIVAYSDLDINQHVNNTRYIEWIMDTINPDSQQSLKQLNIQFKSEFKKEETAVLKMGSSYQENWVFQVEIVHHETGKTGVEATLQFKIE